MTERERTLSAMRGESVDRPPYSFWQHMRPGENLGQPCVDAHIRFAEETGVDFLKVMNDGMSAPFDLESIHTADDWFKLRPMSGKNPYIAEMLFRAGKIVDALGQRLVVHLNLFAPLALIRRVSDEKLKRHIEERPEAVKHALDVIAQEQAYLAEHAVRDMGCDGCVICFQGAELQRFTTEGFDEYVRPYDLRVLNAANQVSEYNIVHFCGWDGWKNRMDLWRAYPGRAVNWAIYVDGMDLVRGREYFGNRSVFGGFDNRREGLLCTQNRRVIMEETVRLVEDYREALGGTQGLMIGADCSLHPNFDRQRILWVRQALEEMV